MFVRGCMRLYMVKTVCSISQAEMFNQVNVTEKLAYQLEIY